MDELQGWLERRVMEPREAKEGEKDALEERALEERALEVAARMDTRAFNRVMRVVEAIRNGEAGEGREERE